YAGSGAATLAKRQSPAKPIHRAVTQRVLSCRLMLVSLFFFMLAFAARAGSSRVLPRRRAIRVYGVGQRALTDSSILTQRHAASKCQHPRESTSARSRGPM